MVCRVAAVLGQQRRVDAADGPGMCANDGCQRGELRLLGPAGLRVLAVHRVCLAGLPSLSHQPSTNRNDSLSFSVRARVMLAAVTIVAVAALLSCTHALGTVVKTANGDVEGAESALGLSWKGVCLLWE